MLFLIWSNSYLFMLVFRSSRWKVKYFLLLEKPHDIVHIETYLFLVFEDSLHSIHMTSFDYF